MKRSDPFELTANKVTGAIALAIVGALLLWWGAGLLFSGPVVEPRLFVAYFDESAGIREGDAVRIQGRRAGHVTDVTVVQHEGRAKARVQFAIAPGRGSPWLSELVDSGGVPSDSSIRIKPGSIRGRPQLVITIGDKDDELIPIGGEWKKTRSANEEDTFSQWQEDINRARDQVGEVVAFFDDEQWKQLTDQLGALRDELEGVDKNVGSIAERSDGLAEGLDEATKAMDSLVEELKARDTANRDDMLQLADSLAKAGAEMDDLHKQLTEAAEQIELMYEQSSDALNTSESKQLQKTGRDLRSMASRLRASMERAVLDPSRAGDMPPSRFWRPYFHGGEPRRGTSIDPSPVTAPGDGLGVPKGVDKPKRAK